MKGWEPWIGGLCGGGAVVAWIAPWPGPARRRAIRLRVPASTATCPGRTTAERLIAGMGRGVRRIARRTPDPAADMRAGVAVLLALVGCLVHPAVGAVLLGAPSAHRVWRVRRGRARAERELVDELPDVVDLFRLAGRGGLTVHQAVDAVREVSDGPIAAALALVRRRTQLGERLADALPLVVDALGEPMRPLVSALVSAERDGAPLAAPLERVADQARDVRRRRAEETARAVPVRLLFPLVLCVLPAFVLLAVVPLLAGTLGSLSL